MLIFFMLWRWKIYVQSVDTNIKVSVRKKCNEPGCGKEFSGPYGLLCPSHEPITKCFKCKISSRGINYDFPTFIVCPPCWSVYQKFYENEIKK